MRGWLALALALLLASPGQAQFVPVEADGGSPVLTVTQELLLTGTRAGQAVQDLFEAGTRDLLAENRAIEAALEAEELDLTNRRAALSPEAFRDLAEAFDEKVERIRTAQDTKSRNLTRQRDEHRKMLLEAAVPVLAAMMQERGAVAILERSTVLLAFERIDITAAAIARLDATLGDGAALFGAQPAPPAPAP